MAALLVACGDSNKAPLANTTEPPPTSTTAQPSTSTTTTTLRSTTTTTTPKSTTTSALGYEISRSTAVAVQNCFTSYFGAMAVGSPTGEPRDPGWTEPIQATCQQAQDEVKVDELGLPSGEYPVRDLDLILGAMQIKMKTQEMFCALRTCTFQQNDFALTDQFLPKAFVGTPNPLHRPGLDDIPGLRVRP